MRLLLFFLPIFSFSLLWGESSSFIPEPENEEQALFLRRIVEFWNEGEEGIVEMQIHQFLSEFPGSSLQDTLYALLGDLSTKKKEYEKAISLYLQITKEEVKETTIPHLLHCYSELEQFDKVKEIGEAYSSCFIEKDREKHNQVLFLLSDALQQMISNEKEPYKKELAEKAIHYLTPLLSTDYHREASYCLASVYALTEQHEKAADLYNTLAFEELENREQLLFEAAHHQFFFDKEKASQTFEKIANLHGEKASEAAYNRLILLFDTNQYEEIITAKKDLERLLSKEHLPALDFYVGCSLFHLDRPKKALQALHTYLDTSTQDSPERKTALLYCIESARKLGDTALFTKSWEEFDLAFPKSEKTPSILFAKALLHKSEEGWEEAKKSLERISKDYPEFENIDEVEWEYAHIFYEQENWSEAHALYKKWIDTFPESPLLKDAWHLLISSAVEFANLEIESHSSLAKQQLCYDLETLLKQNFLNTKEKEDHQFLLGKTLYGLGEYKEAIDLLTPFTENPSTRLQRQAHLLLGYCYKKETNDLDKFCFHAKKALEKKESSPSLQGNETLCLTWPEIDTYSPDEKEIHLSLFNAYLEKEELDQAAEHLFSALCLQAEVCKENHLWLIHYYNSLLTKQDSESREKARYLLENLLQWKEGSPLSFIEPPLEIEKEIFILSKIYQQENRQKKNLELLQTLEKEYIKEPTLPWKCKKELFFALGSSYENLGEKEKALTAYDQLLALSPSFHLKSDAIAGLKSALFTYELLPEKERIKENPLIMKVLTQLKSLCLQKSFDNEPLHLEAAFAYADIKHRLDNNKEKQALLLKKLKTGFEADETILSHDYHSLKEEDPEKKGLFLAYIELMNVEISLVEASSEQERQKAKTTLETLMNNPHATPFIIQRAKERLQLL